MALKTKIKKTSKEVAGSKPATSAKPVASKGPKVKAAAPVTKAAASTPKAKSVQKPAVQAASPAPKAKPVVVAPVDNTQKITLTYFAPEAGSVFVAGDFTKWEASPVSLVKENTGVWKTTLALKPGKYQYRLLVDGQWQNDPQCPELQPNEFGSANCVLSVAA